MANKEVKTAKDLEALIKKVKEAQKAVRLYTASLCLREC